VSAATPFLAGNVFSRIVTRWRFRLDVEVGFSRTACRHAELPRTIAPDEGNQIIARRRSADFAWRRANGDEMIPYCRPISIWRDQPQPKPPVAIGFASGTRRHGCHRLSLTQRLKSDDGICQWLAVERDAPGNGHDFAVASNGAGSAKERRGCQELAAESNDEGSVHHA